MRTADAQADLSLRRAHLSVCWFCRVVVYFTALALPLRAREGLQPLILRIPGDHLVVILNGECPKTSRGISVLMHKA